MIYRLGRRVTYANTADLTKECFRTRNNSINSRHARKISSRVQIFAETNFCDTDLRFFSELDFTVSRLGENLSHSLKNRSRFHLKI